MYVTLEDANKYISPRNAEWNDKTNEEKMAHLQDAHYILDAPTYMGTKVDGNQDHAWPRMINGVSSIPEAIKCAVCEECMQIATQSYTQELKSISVGEISESYYQGDSRSRYVRSPKAQMYIKPYLRQGGVPFGKR